MKFRPLITSPETVGCASKTLLYSESGWGKTTQCRHYKNRFGKGFVISGESGLSVLKKDAIDFLPFTTWDGQHDPDIDVYSFRGICKMMQTPEFAEQQYTWVAIDSISEVGERLMAQLDEVHKDTKNRHEKWADYSRMMIGSLKWFRDLPYHVLVTALERTEEDSNGALRHYPMVEGRSAIKKIPAIFDNVLAGIRVEEEGHDKPVRYVVTDRHDGYEGKVRNVDWPGHNLVPCSDITQIVDYQPHPATEKAA